MRGKVRGVGTGKEEKRSVLKTIGQSRTGVGGPLTHQRYQGCGALRGEILKESRVQFLLSTQMPAGPQMVETSIETTDLQKAINDFYAPGTGRNFVTGTGPTSAKCSSVASCVLANSSPGGSLKTA